MDYKSVVKNYMEKKGYFDKDDKNIKELERDLDFALSKTGGDLYKEAGAFKNILVGLAIAVAAFNAGSAKADSFQMNDLLKSMDGAVHGEVHVKSHVDPNGRGNYTIDVGPYTFDGTFWSINTPKLKSSKHQIAVTIDPKAPEEDVQKYKIVADKIKELLKNDVSKELVK